MPTKPAVTMQDLELERAELLPSRETLNTVQSGLINLPHVLNNSLNKDSLSIF
jgi:hypothetical protein